MTVNIPVVSRTHVTVDTAVHSGADIVTDISVKMTLDDIDLSRLTELFQQHEHLTFYSFLYRYGINFCIEKVIVPITYELLQKPLTKSNIKQNDTCNQKLLVDRSFAESTLYNFVDEKCQSCTNWNKVVAVLVDMANKM